MCGIIGYVGGGEAAPVMIEALRRLEYRGYDSAGAAVIDGGHIKLAKTSGFVAELDKKIQGGAKLSGKIGIGHTRWATHGAPTDNYAHPHLSAAGNIAIVHNGIIDNYARLRERLIAEGCVFLSETDTEVAANLIARLYAKCGDIKQAVAQAAEQMEGAFALGILCEDYPETLVALKKESPLVIGVGDGCAYIASDVVAFLNETREIYRFEDGEIAVITRDDIKFYSPELRELTKRTERVDWDVSAAEKGGYEHFMFKEMLEQPEAVRATLSPRISNGRVALDIELPPEYLRGISRIYFVGCGSAHYVCVVAKYNMEKLARVPSEAVLASEFRYSSPILDETTLVVCVSQSGTTADTIAALREARRLGARVLSIVNVVGSVIAQESDYVLYTRAGPEIAVATTKAYSAQLAVTYLLTLHIADARGTISQTEYEKLLRELSALPNKIEQCLELRDDVRRLAELYSDRENIFFIGRNIDYAMSLEGALKLKEISYIHAEAYAGGELKHGTMALIQDDTLVITMATYGALAGKIVSNAEETRARGASILIITTKSVADTVRHISDNTLTIPDTHELLLPSLAVIPLQLFAYYAALVRDCSIDKPRNLAKSSTVE
ncbi:MAG: glutamine--fructose-6-phosphate transaminase (isomerizing) [Oscillospiraceae bacterium]|jgi:glucosamine--fructose-6-phosphate aminotransferase (isomerizing)|nr:glutamine--fructose-6-phosphate transaminase (isomerizing) [Oscillospiraceae bacterium]